MKSMTGYGRGTTLWEGRQLAVELSSVNRKQAEIIISLPYGWAMLEPKLRNLLNPHLSRGKLTLTVLFTNLGHDADSRSNSEPECVEKNIDLAAACRYYQQLDLLRRHLNLLEPITLETILRGPGVIATETAKLKEEKDEKDDTVAQWSALKKATEIALTDWQAMRSREGEALARDIADRLALLHTQTTCVEQLAPQVQTRYLENLRTRIARAALITIEPNDERLLKEFVLFADRSDITEELTRLRSHLDQCTLTMKKEDAAIGRTLDFVIQEMNREVNTIGSKANDLAITQAVVVMKTELEKIREQLQNIE